MPHVSPDLSRSNLTYARFNYVNTYNLNLNVNINIPYVYTLNALTSSTFICTKYTTKYLFHPHLGTSPHLHLKSSFGEWCSLCVGHIVSGVRIDEITMCALQLDFVLKYLIG